MAGTELQTGEWGLEGLDLNYFAARYYDPILARWHAPDPLEQCHSPYLAMLGDPANFVDPDGRAGIPFLQDFMETGVGDFLECAIGASPGLGFAVLDILGPLGGTISSIVSIGASFYSAGSNVQTLAEVSQAGAERTYGADDVKTDVYCSTSNELNSNLGLQNGQSDPIETKFTTPTIYFVDFPVYSKNLNWQKVVDAMLALINLNQLGEYSIVKISQEDTYKMMQNGGIQPQDAILGIRDGEIPEEWGLAGNSAMDPGTGAASWKESFVSPTIAIEKSRIFKKVGINLSKEEMFAIFALHEVLHQDIQRMHWNVMGQRIQNSFPSIMPHSKGHNNSSPNLMMNGTEWINYALEHPQELHKLKQLLPETYGYVKAYKFGTYIGLTTTTEWRNLLNVIDVLIKR
jgi:RHS repeat-associated protein